MRVFKANYNAETAEGNKKKPMNHKTEIEIEMSETVAYSRPSERFENFCPACKSLVEMATPQVAAILTHSNEREIYRLVEMDKVHFVETDRTFVCLNSLTEKQLGVPPLGGNHSISQQIPPQGGTPNTGEI